MKVRSSLMQNKTIRCPKCGGGYRMLVKQYDGSIKCLQCNCIFKMGFGIQHVYPRLPLPLKLKSYIAIMRPFTLLPVLIAGIIGGMLPLLANNLDPLPYWNDLIFIGVTLALLQAVGQITNQVADVEIDRISKPYRPLVKGLVSREEAMGIAWALAIFGIARAFTLGVLFGLLSSVILIFAVFYNLPPRVKRFTWVGNLWLGVSRGLLPFLATWCVFGSLLSPAPYVLGIFAFGWVFALNATKDFADIRADREFGIRTLPVRYGIEVAAKIMMLLSVMPFAFLGYALIFAPNFWPLLLTASLLPLVFYGLKFRGPTENSWGWVGFYAGICLIFLLAICCVI